MRGGGEGEGGEYKRVVVRVRGCVYLDPRRLGPVGSRALAPPERESVGKGGRGGKGVREGERVEGECREGGRRA